MRAKIVTPTAESDVRANAQHIRLDNPSAADRYGEQAITTFIEWPDEVIPRRASPNLPEHIRELPVSGFRRYTLRIATIDDVTYLLAAFAPGLPDAFKDERTVASLRAL